MRPYDPAVVLLLMLALRAALQELGRAVADPLLKGGFSGDFGAALAALLGKDAPGLSASTIARLKDVWAEEHKAWEKRDLSTKRYVSVWADGLCSAQTDLSSRRLTDRHKLSECLRFIRCSLAHDITLQRIRYRQELVSIKLRPRLRLATVIGRSLDDAAGKAFMGVLSHRDQL